MACIRRKTRTERDINHQVVQQYYLNVLIHRELIFIQHSNCDASITNPSLRRERLINHISPLLPLLLLLFIEMINLTQSMKNEPTVNFAFNNRGIKDDDDTRCTSTPNQHQTAFSHFLFNILILLNVIPE